MKKPKKVKKKNILLILTDQQSAKMMSCAGNRYLATPAMDSMAERGVRFDLAFCTNPVCVPSRFSLFTGRYSSEIGQCSNSWDGNALPKHIVEAGLGHVIRKAGYEVAYGGKEHLPKTNAVELGFDYICKDERDELAKRCADFIKDTRNDSFFLVVSFINPHDICHIAVHEFAETDHDFLLKNRYVKEREMVKKACQLPPGISEGEFYKSYCPPLPTNHMPQEDEPEAIQELVRQRPFRWKARQEWGERKWRLHRWAYHRLTEIVDRQIGIVLKALRETGLEDDTVVIFTSDHGDHDSSHKLEHKTALYEEALRIPLIVCAPNAIAPGNLNREHLVCNGIDLFPTICDYAGVGLPEDLTGVSLRPLVEDRCPDDPWRDHLLIESEFGYGIRTHGYFYAIYDRGEKREQLYDLRRDPGQTRNFADDPTYAGILATHRQLACAAKRKR